MQPEYTIDPELQKIMPELSEEEYKELEESLLTDGYKGAPIIVWKKKGIIVDGHNRYSICQKHNIPFEVKELEFDDQDDVVMWMLRAQLGRRNLEPLQRMHIVEKFRPLYQKKAKENQIRAGKEYGNGGTKVTANLPQPLNEGKKERNPTVDKQLSEIAGVSERTYRMGRQLLDSGNKELIEAVNSKKKTISGAYKELKGEQKGSNEKVTANLPQAVDNQTKEFEGHNSTMEENVVKDDIVGESLKLSQIQKRYSDYLGIFEKDISALITKYFYQDDEDITGKVHSELRNCLEKFKSIKVLIENMEKDDLDDNSIVVNRF